MKRIISILILGLILGIVAISGCTSSGSNSNTINLNNTFSKGGLTFNYPSTYVESSAGEDVVSGSSQVQILGTLFDPNDQSNITFIQVRKLPLNGATVESLYNIQRMSFAQVNYQILTDTRNTTNGITIYKFIYNGTNPNSGQNVKGYELIFGKDGDVVYAMQIQGSPSSFNTIRDIEQRLESTIKLS